MSLGALVAVGVAYLVLVMFFCTGICVEGG
jgi:hypothetical protein